MKKLFKFNAITFLIIGLITGIIFYVMFIVRGITTVQYCDFNQFINIIKNSIIDTLNNFKNDFNSNAPIVILISAIIFGLLIISLVLKGIFKLRIFRMIFYVIIAAVGFISFVLATLLADTSLTKVTENVSLLQYLMGDKLNFIKIMGYITGNSLFLSSLSGLFLIKKS